MSYKREFLLRKWSLVPPLGSPPQCWCSYFKDSHYLSQDGTYWGQSGGTFSIPGLILQDVLPQGKISEMCSFFDSGPSWALGLEEQVRAVGLVSDRREGSE